MTPRTTTSRLLRSALLGPVIDATRRAISRVAPATTVRWDGFEITGNFEHGRELAAIEAGSVEELTLSHFVAAIEPGDTVVDVGAFLGLFTLKAARAVGPEGRVIAFEPDPSTFRALAATVERNGFASRVELVAGAAGAKQGVVRLTRSVEDPSTNTTVDGHGSFEVDVFTVDERAGPDRIAVCKIDVEGAELSVLEGMTRHLADVRCLIVECHPAALALAGETSESLTQRLRDAGFAIEALDDKTGQVSAWPFELERSHVNLHGYRAEREESRVEGR